jgi:hypothetical protein
MIFDSLVSTWTVDNDAAFTLELFAADDADTVAMADFFGDTTVAASADVVDVTTAARGVTLSDTA